ncbi:MAG: hypothetical protein KF726_17930 [Anaerolineae bacterium]|nr:hypothetical protein [Anaerolineae bacterium]
MSSSRIRMTHPYGQTPPNTFSDFDWVKRVLLNKPSTVFRQQLRFHWKMNSEI